MTCAYPRRLSDGVVAPPFGQDLHVQIEEDALAEQRLDLGARRGAEAS